MSVVLPVPTSPVSTMRLCRDSIAAVSSERARIVCGVQKRSRGSGLTLNGLRRRPNVARKFPLLAVGMPLPRMCSSLGVELASTSLGWVILCLRILEGWMRRARRRLHDLSCFLRIVARARGLGRLVLLKRRPPEGGRYETFADGRVSRIAVEMHGQGRAVRVGGRNRRDVGATLEAVGVEWG